MPAPMPAPTPRPVITPAPVPTSGGLFNLVGDIADPPSPFGTPMPDTNVPIDTGDVDIGPTRLGEVESIFEILSAVMAGTQGVPEGVSSEVLRAIETDYSEAAPEELLRIAQEIAEAGGWEAWAEANGIDIEGPPEEPPTDIEQPEPEEPEQVTISLEDFQEIYSSNPDDDNYLDPAEYMEDGTYTDPETGIVYVINIPPELPDEEEPTEEEGGGGEPEPEQPPEPEPEQPPEPESNHLNRSLSTT